MRKKKASKELFLVFLSFFLVLGVSLANFLSLLNRQHINIGDSILPELVYPTQLFHHLIVQVSADRENILWQNDRKKQINFVLTELTPIAVKPGRLHLRLKLFGLIPVRQLAVDIVPPVSIVPGGHSIGILVQPQGLMVVGRALIHKAGDWEADPAGQAGIRIGDLITKVNGREAVSEKQIQEEINQSGQKGKTIDLEIKRDKKIFTLRVKAIFCPETRRYRIGLFIKDSAAGIGTLTFYDPLSKSFGALGHSINNLNTNQQMDLARGKIVAATVLEIRIGQPGQPGEKIGYFQVKGNIAGNIVKNSNYGIYGYLQQPLVNPIYPKPLPVALSYQIKKGPAEILTVVKENQIRRFTVEIQQVLPYAKASGKGLMLKVTDPELLKQTGGIVQGMSGSPIIQEGKFIGAVTHVFINDPTCGYGIPVEWMLWENKAINTSTKLEKTRNIA
ncbi:MAG TPA: SpoIVB peptidase [Desulfotomaculum sp.]|nr:SpoIVB peptidase [Desulfotomaculum sp.]